MTTANPFANKKPAAAAATTTTAAAATDNAAFDTPPSTKPEPKHDTSDPFASPTGGGSGEKITDLVGSLLLAKPTEEVVGITTSIGVGDAIRTDVVILDGDRQGDLVPDMLVFQTALRRDLKRILEGPKPYVLGRLAIGTAKAGKSAPYIFEQPTEADAQLARQYLAAQG